MSDDKKTDAPKKSAAETAAAAAGEDPKVTKVEPSAASADAAALASGEEAPTEPAKVEGATTGASGTGSDPATVEDVVETSDEVVTPEKELATTGEDEVVSQTSLSTSVDTAIEIPEWLKGKDIVGVENVGDFMTTPRLTIIQAMSEEERKDMFGEASAVIMPDGVLVAKKGEEFIGIPLIFWVTYEQWADINDSNSDMVLEVTQDANSVLARKARSKATRTEVYGQDGEFLYKFLESLNFIVMIDSGPAKGELVTMSFSIGEHHTGTKLCGLFKRRQMSLFANRVAFKVSSRNRNNLNWFGYNFGNPAEVDGGAVVQDEARYNELAKIHEGLKGLVAKGQVIVDHSGEDGSTVVGDVVDEGGDTVHPDI